MSSISDISGTLLIVATPLGNLGDITERALDALRQADLVAAEDTRRASQLLSHFGISKPTESFHGDSDDRKTARLVKRLLSGDTVAYVSDAGTPTISDPGAALVASAVEAGIVVSPIPGPSAITTALSASGLNADRFEFWGYPPRKKGEKEEFIRTILTRPHTVVIYEAPSRVVHTLGLLAGSAVTRRCAVCRELTKKFEEFVRGTLGEAALHFTAHEPRGEFVIVIENAKATDSAQEQTMVTAEAIDTALSEMLANGMPVKAGAKVIAALGLLPKNAAYQRAIELSNPSHE